MYSEPLMVMYVRRPSLFFFFVIFLCFYFVADDFMHLIMTGPT